MLLGIIAAVKKLICLTLALWIGLLAGFAQAHAVTEELHQLQHMVQAVDGGLAPDDAHEEHCGPAHCSHVPGVAFTAVEFSFSDGSAKAFASLLWHTSINLPDQIERPKWALATTAVASL